MSDWSTMGEYGTSNSLEMLSWEARTTVEARWFCMDRFGRAVCLAGSKRGFPDIGMDAGGFYRMTTGKCSTKYGGRA